MRYLLLALTRSIMRMHACPPLDFRNNYRMFIRAHTPIPLVALILAKHVFLVSILNYINQFQYFSS